MKVDVAQLVEPRIVIPVVVGSSPIVHPSFFMIYILIYLFQTGCYNEPVVKG